MLTRIGSNYLGTYYFHIKDHQGNIRLVTSDAGSVVQTNYYDPYGETSYGPLTSNINHYSGKEWDSRLRAYDFGARMYMPSYSRFTTMDPLCEQDPGRSPYLYCAGNPVNLVDPDGKDFRKYKRFNTIHIYANYYAHDDLSYRSAEQGVNHWNNRKSDTYTDQSTGITYNIRYHLAVEERAIQNDDKPHDNMYEVNDTKVDNNSSNPAVGVTIGHKQIYVKNSVALKHPDGKTSSTPAHEIGHTLGMSDSPKGLMSERQDENRSDQLLDANIQEMMNSKAGGEMKTDFITRVYEKIKNLF